MSFSPQIAQNKDPNSCFSYAKRVTRFFCKFCFLVLLFLLLQDSLNFLFVVFVFTFLMKLGFIFYRAIQIGYTINRFSNHRIQFQIHFSQFPNFRHIFTQCSEALIGGVVRWDLLILANKAISPINNYISFVISFHLALSFICYTLLLVSESAAYIPIVAALGYEAGVR